MKQRKAVSSMLSPGILQITSLNSAWIDALSNAQNCLQTDRRLSDCRAIDSSCAQIRIALDIERAYEPGEEGRALVLRRGFVIQQCPQLQQLLLR